MADGRPQVRDGVDWIAVGNDIVAVDWSGGVHVVETTAALVFPLLDGSATVDELAADVADVFGIDIAAARSDVDALTTGLAGRGLLADGDSDGDGSDVSGTHGPGAAPDDDTDRAAGPRRVARPAESSGSPPPEPRWIAQMTISAADFHVGLAADDGDVVEMLATLYGERSVNDETPPDFGISVSRRGGAGPRLVPELLHQTASVVCSRLMSRLYRVLDGVLGIIEESVDPTLPRVMATSVLVRDGRAALVPQQLVQQSTAVERALLAAGTQLADNVSVRLDIVTGDVVIVAGLLGDVAHPALADALAVAPGRYPISSIWWADDQVGDAERPATGVARLVDLVEKPPGLDRGQLLACAAGLADRFSPDPAPRSGADLTAIEAKI